MQNIHVRRGTLDDLSQLAQLFDQYRYFYLNQSDHIGAEEFIQQRLSQNDSYIFVYEDEQKSLNGFIQLYPILSSVSMQQALILNDLYVGELFRNKGVATELMQTVIDFAREKQVAWMELETGIENFKAQALYRKMGMQRLDKVYRFSIDFNAK